MGKRNKGRKQQNASNSKEKLTKAQEKSPNSSLEEGEIRDVVEETDPGHSSSTNTTPDRLPLAATATALTLQESTEGNTSEENGGDKKQGDVSNSDTTPDKLPPAAMATVLPLQESTEDNTGEKNGSDKKQGDVSNSDTTPATATALPLQENNEGNTGEENGGDKKQGDVSNSDTTPDKLPPAAMATVLPLQESTEDNTGEKNGSDKKQGDVSNSDTTPATATALPLQENNEGNTGEENGSDKKQEAVSNKDIAEGSNETSSGRKETETSTEGSEISNPPPPPPDWDISTPLTDLGTCETEAIASKAVNGSSNTRKRPTIKNHAQLTDDQLLAECTPKNTISQVLVGNISTDTTENDLTQLFGLRTTPELKKNVRIKFVSDRTHKFRRYALIEGPRDLINNISDLNGKPFNNRKLEIELCKSDNSAFSRGRWDLQRTGFNKATAQTSGNKTTVGDLRPVSSASSGPEESAPCTNGEQGEPTDANPEVVGGGTNNLIKNDKSMAQHIRAKHNRQNLEERKRRQLLFEVYNNHSGMTFPDASVVYAALTEGLGLSKDPSQNDVQAIYKPDPENPWKWGVLFASEELTNKYQGQDVTIEANGFTYTFIATKTVKPLLITIHSTPLITDDELKDALGGFGEVIKITRQSHTFANIDSGIRKIFLVRKNGVQTRDIPGFIRTSDGIRRKLHFRGKLYFCGGCLTKHTYTEGCPIFQDGHTNDQQIQLEQSNNTDTPQTEQHTKSSAQTEQNTENITNLTTSVVGRNRTKRAQTEQHTDDTKKNKQTKQNTETDTNKGEDNTNITGTPNSQEEEFPMSPCVVSNTPRPYPADAANSLTNREGNTDSKSMEKGNKTRKDNPKKQKALDLSRSNSQRWKF